MAILKVDKIKKMEEKRKNKKDVIKVEKKEDI